MKHIFYRLGLALACLFPLVLPPAFASDVRVESAGGIGLVMTDETTDLSPYNLGNPAGLALLDPQNRLQFEAPIAFMDYTQNAHWNNYGLQSGEYQGLLVIPGDDWAFQVSGGLIDSSVFGTGTSGQDPTALGEAEQQGNETISAAYHWDRFTFGANFSLGEEGQNSTNLPAGVPPEGDSSFNNNLNLGALLDIPLENSLVRLGGNFQFNPAVNQAQYNTYDMVDFNAYPVTLTYQTTGYGGGPAVYIQVPRVFQGAASLEWTHSEESYTEAAPPSSPLTFNNGPYLAMIQDTFNLNAALKCRFPLNGDPSPNSLCIIPGADFNYSNSIQNYYNYPENYTGSNPATVWNLQIGLGLEQYHVFTLGSQLGFEGFPGYAGEIPLNLGLGGEAWLSPEWALRAAGTYISDESGWPSNLPGAQTFPIFYNGQAWLFSVGSGYEGKDIHLDAMAFFGSDSQTGSPSSLQPYGAEVALAWFWGQNP